MMKQPKTLYELAIHINVLSEGQIVRALTRFNSMRPSRIEDRLDVELSKFDDSDVALIRKLIHCIIARSCVLSERSRTILISRLSEAQEHAAPWSHGAPPLRRELDDEDNYDFHAEGFGDITVTHKLFLPGLDEFFETVKKAIPKNRTKSIEKLSLNLTSMFLCSSKEAFYLAMANIVAEFVSVYDVVSTLLEKIDFECLYQLISRVGKFLVDPKGYEAQSNVSFDTMDTDSFGALFRVLATGYAYIFDEKINRFPTFSTEWQKNLFAAYRNTSCIPELYDFMIMFVRSAYEFFQIYVLGVDVDFDKTLCQVDATYDDWKKDLFHLETMYMDPLDGIYRNSETRRQIIDHYLLGQKLNDVIEHRKTVTRGAGAHFQTMFAKSTKMATEARKAGNSSTFRAPPYMIQIQGASGIGKSTCIERTVMYLNQFEKMKYDEGNLIFTRKATSQYWEGYHSQLAVVYDDLFQIKETKDRAAAAEEIVDVCNSVPLALNMAELSAKGNVMFNSKYVFATTNVWEERSIGLAHPDALWRRFGSRWKFWYPKKYAGARGPNWDQMHKDNPQFKKEGRESELMYAKLKCTLVKPNGYTKTMSYDKFLEYIYKDAQKKFHFDMTAIQVNRRYIDAKFGKIEKTPTPTCRVVYHPVMGEVKIPYEQSMEAQGMFGEDMVLNFNLCPDALQKFTDDETGELLQGTELRSILYETPSTHNLIDTVHHTISKYEPTYVERACDYVDSLVHGAVRAYRPLGSEEEIKSFSTITHLREAKEVLKMTSYQTIFDVAFKCLLVMAAFKAGGSLYKTFRRGAHWSQTLQFETQSNEFKDKKRRKKRKVKGSKPSSFYSSDQQYDDDYDAQGKGTDSNYLSKIRGNMCRIECNFVYDDFVRKESQNILFVTGSSALTTAHLLYKFEDCIKESSFVRLITGSMDKIIHATDLTWITPDERCGLDVGLLKFNIKGIQRPDITSRFVTESQLDNVRVNECTLMKFCRTSDRKGVFVDREIDSGKLGKGSPTYTSMDDEYTVTDYIRYKCFTERGDCGSVITHNDSSIAAAILGIHVAGRPNSPDGLGQVVTRELLNIMLEKAGITTRREAVVECAALGEDDLGEFAAYGEIDTIGRLAPEDATRMPCKTTLLPSLVHDVFQEHTHVPAMLTKTDGISPVHVALKKANVPDGKLDHELFKECELHMEDIRKALPTYGLARTLTNKEMVNGLPGTNFLKPMNIHTSPGFPYVKKRKMPGKQDWFRAREPDNDGSEILMSLKFKAEFEEAEEKLARGIIPMFPFVSCLKDEKREKSKAALGKTRLFSVGNQLHLALCRKYNGGYVAFLTANKDILPSKVGLVMNGVGFADFYQYMVAGRTKSEALNNANDGDFSGFDDSLMSECIVSFFESARRWYLFHNGTDMTPQQRRDDTIRRNLIQTFIGPPHMIGKMLYSLTKANSSGGFATVHINGHANELAHRYTFCELAKDRNMDNVDFDKYINLATYGDDSLMVIGDEVVDFFNGMTIAPIFKEAFGMTYTTATKGAAETPVRPMSDVDFCKRKFHFNHDLKKMVGRMEVSNILEITNWIRKSNDDEYSTLQNVESAHREFVLHGKDVYNEYSRIFVDGCARVGLTYTPRSFRSLQNDFYKNEL